MSDAVVIALIASGPPTLVGVALLVTALKQSKKIDAVHKDTNGNFQAAVDKIERLEKRIAGLLEGGAE